MDFQNDRGRILEQLRDLTHGDIFDLGGGSRPGPDLELRAGEHTFFVEFKARSSAEAIGSALMQVASWGDEASASDFIPLVAVP